MKWFPVTERMPGLGSLVLIRDCDEQEILAHFVQSGGMYSFRVSSGVLVKSVVEWRDPIFGMEVSADFT